MKTTFELKKTAQAAAFLLGLEPGLCMGRMRLLKLLYISDRECLARYCATITGDSPYALQKGPILSHTYNLIKSDRVRESGVDFWQAHLKSQGYKVVLVNDPGNEELSEAIEEILCGVYARYADMDDEEVSEASHKFQEWRDAFKGGETSYPFGWERALVAQGKGDQVDAAVESESIRSTLIGLFGKG